MTVARIFRTACFPAKSVLWFPAEVKIYQSTKPVLERLKSLYGGGLEDINEFQLKISSLVDIGLIM